MKKVPYWAAVVSIGNELTDGQIVNKNAAWLAEQLLTLGIRTRLHITVPDDRELILMALQQSFAKNQFVFVTGGLGPTTDDFTREVIAEWTEKPLQFDQASWESIQERLQSRGFVVKDFQKQQAFFPGGSIILKNNQGTANGFFMDYKSTKIAVLPGPPREIAGIWNDSLKKQVADSATHIDRWVVRKWDVMGVGESDVANEVEVVFADFKSFAEIGYRVHLPYVETKLQHYESVAEKVNPLIGQITEKLAAHLVSRDGFDHLSSLQQQLPKGSHIVLEDAATAGFLMKRLRYDGQLPVVLQASEIPEDSVAPRIYLGLDKMDYDQCQIQIKWLDENNQAIRQQDHLLVAPQKAALMQERRQQYIAEKTLICLQEFVAANKD